MVPVPVPAPSAVERVALVGVPRVTMTVSLASSIASPLTGMVIVPVVSPGAMSRESGSGAV